jgi:hypothetical protein
VNRDGKPTLAITTDQGAKVNSKGVRTFLVPSAIELARLLLDKSDVPDVESQAELDNNFARLLNRPNSQE